MEDKRALSEGWNERWRRLEETLVRDRGLRKNEDNKIGHLRKKARTNRHFEKQKKMLQADQGFNKNEEALDRQEGEEDEARVGKAKEIYEDRIKAHEEEKAAHEQDQAKHEQELAKLFSVTAEPLNEMDERMNAYGNTPVLHITRTQVPP